MSENNLTIRFYKPGDELQINRLFASAFHINRSREEWVWKFQNNPMGSSIIVIGEIEDKIVAHIAAVPVGIKMGDKFYLCYQSLDSMADPLFNSRLIFMRVFRRLQEEIKNMGQVHFGFPNKKAHGLLTKKRIGENDLGKVDIFCIKLREVSSYMPAPGLEEFNLQEINEFDDRFTCLWRDLSSLFKIKLIRDKEYLNWRYIYKPDNDYKVFASGDGGITGYIVLKVYESNGQKIGSIMDLFAPDDSLLCGNMLKNALVYFKSLKVDLIVCYHRNRFLSQCLLKLGFSPVSDRDYEDVFSQMWLIGSNFSLCIPNELFLDESSWSLMMGDTDWM